MNGKIIVRYTSEVPAKNNVVGIFVYTKLPEYKKALIKSVKLAQKTIKSSKDIDFYPNQIVVSINDSQDGLERTIKTFEITIK